MPIKTILLKKISIDIISTFLVRMSVTVGSIVLGIALGRYYGASGLGVFAICQACVIGANTISSWGMNKSLIKYAANHRATEVKDLYFKLAAERSSKASWLSVIFVLIVSAILFFKSVDSDLSISLAIMAFSIPAFTFCFIASGYMKGIGRPRSAVLLENGAISIITVLAIFLINQKLESRSIIVAALSFSTAAWIIYIYAIWRIKKAKKIDYKVGLSAAQEKDFYDVSTSFMSIGIVAFFQSSLAIIIISFMLPADDVGVLKAAERAALSINFILMVLNAIFPPIFARKYHDNNFPALEKYARLGSLIGFIIAAPVFVMVLAFSNDIMMVFGDEFSGTGYLLLIIASAQMINVITGSVSYLLGMCGREKTLKKISIMGFTLGVTTLIILTPIFGVLGAAISLAIVIVFQNMCSLFVVIKEIKIAPLFIMPRMN